ncbi:MAG: hypothetical protein GY868_09315 [Deltaproteobacteria bacterium]|nr:hypothetical protein [Deltaproteobacteria bacterium]
MTHLEKLRVVLPHWIDHNRSHGEEFDRWAQLLAETGENEIASLIETAGRALVSADEALALALEKAGGEQGSQTDEHRHTHP